MSFVSAISASRRTLPAFAAEGVFWGTFAAYVPQIKAAIGASDGLFGLILLATATGAVVAMWFAPRFETITGRGAMAVAAVMLALSFQAPMWVSAPLVFCMLMVTVGASAGLLDVVMNAQVSRIEAERGLPLMNLNHGVFSLAYAVAAILSAITREQGVPPGVVVVGWMVLILLVAPFMVTRAVPDDETTEQQDTKAIRVPPAVIWGGLIIFVAFLSENAVESWSALHIERTLGGGAAEGALGPAMLGITMAVGRFAGQLVVVRLGEARVVFWAGLLSALGAMIAALAPAPLVAYVGFGILGAGISVIAPMVFALIGRGSSDAVRAKAISRAAVIGYFGFFVGPPLMGLVSEGVGLRGSFAVVALILLSTPLLLAGLSRGRS